MKKLIELEAKMDNAKMKLTEEMRRTWPRGERVFFMIRHGQVKPSTGVVMHHREEYLRVKMGNSARDVYFKDVI